jgi:hypothetical protein
MTAINLQSFKKISFIVSESFPGKCSELKNEQGIITQKKGNLRFLSTVRLSNEIYLPTSVMLISLIVLELIQEKFKVLKQTNDNNSKIRQGKATALLHNIFIE